MSAVNWAAERAEHELGHVAKAAVRYTPRDAVITDAVRARFAPWECTFHCNDGGPRRFVAFGGRAGMESAVRHFLGGKATGASS